MSTECRENVQLVRFHHLTHNKRIYEIFNAVQLTAVSNRWAGISASPSSSQKFDH